MPKLKSVTPSQSIKYGSFETWVLVAVSTVNDARVELALPSYMYPSGVDVSNPSSSLSNNSKEGVRRKMRMMVKVILIIRHFLALSFSIGLIQNQIGSCYLTYLQMIHILGRK